MSCGNDRIRTLAAVDQIGFRLKRVRSQEWQPWNWFEAETCSDPFRFCLILFRGGTDHHNKGSMDVFVFFLSRCNAFEAFCLKLISLVFSFYRLLEDRCTGLNIVSSLASKRFCNFFISQLVIVPTVIPVGGTSVHTYLEKK